MLNNQTVAVVVPAYNEGTQILKVIETMPAFVDRIVIVNDCSKDNTAQVVLDYVKANPVKDLQAVKSPVTEIIKDDYNYADQVAFQIRREEDKEYTKHEVLDSGDNRVILINHLENGGVGAAISTGYLWCREHQIDCTAVMAGDGQMAPDELEGICLPVIEGKADYVKGNRLIHRAARAVVPKIRFIGNSMLSILTKIASGYWHISDTQTGYTSISLEALEGIDIHKIYKSYGMPNDILVKLNIASFRVKEIAIKPVYNVGEQSKMKVSRVIRKVSWLLVKLFLQRLFTKYFFRSFHPLFICYIMFFFCAAASTPLLSYLIYDFVYNQNVNDNYLIVSVFTGILTIQFLLFGMWFDMQDNEKLNVE